MTRNVPKPLLVATIHVLLCATNLSAQSLPPYLWVKTAGGSTSDASRNFITDSAGNIYTSGFFSGTAQFGATTLTATASSTGAFVAKQNAHGDYLWAREFPKLTAAFNTEWQPSIAVDAAGNLYTAGRFQGTTSLTFGDTALTAPGTTFHYSVFITKQAPDGSYTWATMIRNDQSVNGSIASVTALSSDAAGNLYIAGIFTEGINFDPGAGTAILFSSFARSGFLVKLDNLGNLVWAKGLIATAGSTDNRVHIQSITVDVDGNVYTSGIFRIDDLAAGQSVDFDPGAGVNALRPGGPDESAFFINKLDANGEHVWTRTYGNTSTIQDGTTAIKVDDDGNVYATGFFTGTTIDFDPGAGSFPLTDMGSGDAFMIKLTPAGDFAWVNQIGGTNTQYIRGFSLDGSGNIYLTGRMHNTVDFDPGPGSYPLTGSPNLPLPYTAKWTNQGNFVDAQMLSNGSAATGEGMGIIVNSTGTEVLVAGDFTGTMDFDAGTGTNTATAAGYDLFVLKLSSSSLPITLKEFNAYAKGSTAELNWVTASESNNKGFVILRSPDGRNWQQIGYVPSKADEGNSVHEIKYVYTDPTPLTGISYYRLKQEDINGKTSLSPIRPVQLGNSSSITLFPNPAKGWLYLSGLSGGETLFIYNATGQLLGSRQVNQGGIYTLPLQGLSKGMHYLQVNAPAKPTQTFKITVE